MANTMAVDIGERTSMQLIGTLLCGNNEDIVGDALRSVVDWVDTLLLIDTGITDQSINVARKIVGEKLVVRKYEWCNDFSEARNLSLEMASDLGADWALTIDTDERMLFDDCNGPDDLKAKLDTNPDVKSWLVSTSDNVYSKERFTRVPSKLQWNGRTHEALCGCGPNEQQVFPHCRFWELQKSDEAMQFKLERDLRILLEETDQDPESARWWYYLGQTCRGLSLHRKAIDAYKRCAELSTWKEEAAWACYCAGTSHIALNEFDEALEATVKGMHIQPQSPDIAWQAGFCCFKLNRFRDAIAWEEMAVALGHFRGIGAGSDRVANRHVPGWYEAPFDVMRFAYKYLGELENEEKAQKDFDMAFRARLTVGGTSESHFSESQYSRSKPYDLSVTEAVTPVAVAGLYRAGCSRVGGILFHLGVSLGNSFSPDHFEPLWLSQQLRNWWSEPLLEEQNSTKDRIRAFREWLSKSTDDKSSTIGAQHPLLSLCANDLREAWGPKSKFVWAYRPMEDAVAELVRLGWWRGKERYVQEKLRDACEEFFGAEDHLRVDFEKMKTNPKETVYAIVEYLELEPDEHQLSRAISFI